MSKEIFESYHKVRTFECDSYGHVNNATYLNYLEYARMEALEKKGITLPLLKNSGYMVIIKKVEIEYKYPASIGEILKIKTWLKDHRNTSGTFRQEVSREFDNRQVAIADVLWVFTNLEGRPIPIPKIIQEAFGFELKSRGLGKTKL
jgi:acyl-CoA thioester hydrolase